LNQKLINYIKKEQARDTSKAEIIEALVANGWKKEVVEELYREAAADKKTKKNIDLDFGFEAIYKNYASIWQKLFYFAIFIYITLISIFIIIGSIGIFFDSIKIGGPEMFSLRVQVIINLILAFSLMVFLIFSIKNRRNGYIFLAIVLILTAIEMQIYRVITVNSFSFSIRDLYNWALYGTPSILLLLFAKIKERNS